MLFVLSLKNRGLDGSKQEPITEIIMDTSPRVRFRGVLSEGFCDTGRNQVGRRTNIEVVQHTVGRSYQTVEDNKRQNGKSKMTSREQES